MRLRLILELDVTQRENIEKTRSFRLASAVTSIVDRAIELGDCPAYTYGICVFCAEFVREFASVTTR